MCVHGALCQKLVFHIVNLILLLLFLWSLAYSSSWVMTSGKVAPLCCLKICVSKL